jgi:hypothetical protein
MTGDTVAIVQKIRSTGFSFAPAEQFRPLLTPSALAEWPSFAATWDDLGLDTYMADGGRYRRRRFVALAVSSEGVVRKPHQAHYQSRDYNPLNGGIERWFGPVSEAITVHPVTLSLLDVGRQVFDALTPAPDRPQAWHVELHQFRIEARVGKPASRRLRACIATASIGCSLCWSIGRTSKAGSRRSSAWTTATWATSRSPILSMPSSCRTLGSFMR